MLTLYWIIFIVSVVNNPKLPPSADTALLVSSHLYQLLLL